MVEHSLSKRKVVGSSPACGLIFLRASWQKSRQGGSNPRSTAYEAVALPLGHTGTQQKCILRGSNPRGLSPLGLKSSALTTRPRMHVTKVRQPGVEPGAKAWEASMLPIHHWRELRGSNPARAKVQVTGFEPVPLSRLAPKANALTTAKLASRDSSRMFTN